MIDRKSFTAGVAATLAIVLGVTWVALIWQPATPHSELYDQCLASGRSVMACDAAMRVLATEREKTRRELSCLIQAKDGNPFDKIGCEAN